SILPGLNTAESIDSAIFVAKIINGPCSSNPSISAKNVGTIVLSTSEDFLDPLSGKIASASSINNTDLCPVFLNDSLQESNIDLIFCSVAPIYGDNNSPPFT